MPKIGEMEEKNDANGEVFYAGRMDIREVKSFKATANPRGQGDNAPEYLIIAGGREMGCMWKRGPDRNGKPYFEMKLDGYPLRQAVYVRAFATDDPALFEVNYSAPRAAVGGQEGAA